MRKKVIAGNWKMNMLPNEAMEMITKLAPYVKDAESDQWIYFDYVPGQFDIRMGNPDYTGKVVVIAAGYTEDELEEIFLG